MNPIASFTSTLHINEAALVPHHVIPNILTERQTETLKKFIKQAIRLGKIYEEFSKRKGVTWDNFWVDTSIPALLENEQCIQIRNEMNHEKWVHNGSNLKKVHPSSVFDNEECTLIIKNLVSRFFREVVETYERGKDFSPPFYFQAFLTRTEVKPNHVSEFVKWHQDSGENTDVAQYTLVVLLSDPDQEKGGWEGGKMNLRSLKDSHSLIEVSPAYRQGIIFDNEHSEHSVTQVQAKDSPVQRDILILCMHLHP